MQIRVPADVVLGPRGEREREVQRASRLDCGGDPIDGLVTLVDGAFGIEIFDRATARPGLGDPDDRGRLCRTTPTTASPCT